MVEPLRHRQTKGAGTDMCYLKPPRHISTLPSKGEILASRCFPLGPQTRTLLDVVGRSQTCHQRKAITPKNGRSGRFSQTHAIWLANYRVSWLLTGVTSRQRATWHSIFMGFLKGLPAFDRLVSK